MMIHEERRKILESLTDFIPAEMSYKKLYMHSSDAYATPIRDWEEFKERLSEQSTGTEIPRSSPSPILTWLSEDEWFPAKALDVSIVKNDRYCPPFWHRLEFIKIVYVISGSVILFIKNRKIEIKEGNLCIVSPCVENAEFSANDDDVVVNIIVKRSTFEKSFASLLMEDSRLSDYFWRMLYKKNGSEVLFFRKAGDDDLTEQVLQLYRELKMETVPSNIMLKSYLMLFFAYMIRNYEKDDAVSEVSYNYGERYCRIIKYINDNKQTVTLSVLAENFGLSEGYMSRYIRREAGMPFNVLLKRMRIEEAAVMLKNSECSIEDVAYTVGYSDVSRFYRNFKERYGVTPAHFRKIGLI